MQQIKFQKLFLAIITMTALFSTSCSDNDNSCDDLPEVKKGKVTFIHYSQADENIALQSVDQIKELSASCNADYRAVAMINLPEIHRKKIGQELKLDEVGTLQFHMAGDGTSKLMSNSRTALTDMSKPETLTALLNKAVELYPAEEYVIILDGHGLGWEYGKDGTRSAPSGEVGMEGLTVTGICNGIKSSAVNGKVKLIYFDACLMATYEYLGDLAPYTSYIIGAPTVSLASFGKMEKFVNLIKNKPDWQSAVKSITLYLSDSYKDARVVMLAIKTAGTSELFAKMKQLNVQLNRLAMEDDDDKQAIIEAAKSTFRFNKNDDEDEKEEEEQAADLHFIDDDLTLDGRSLVDFYYRAKAVDPSLEHPYADFVAALDKVVIASEVSDLTDVQLAIGNKRYGLSMLFFSKNTYETKIKDTWYKNLIFAKETNPELLFSIFSR